MLKGFILWDSWVLAGLRALGHIKKGNAGAKIGEDINAVASLIEVCRLFGPVFRKILNASFFSEVNEAMELVPRDFEAEYPLLKREGRGNNPPY